MARDFKEVAHLNIDQTKYAKEYDRIFGNRKERSIAHDYFDISDLPTGDLPYSAIDRALKDEKYLRKYTPVAMRTDLTYLHYPALLIYYPDYIDTLYDLAAEGLDYMSFFHTYPTEITEAFNYLFPEAIKKLERVKQSKLKLTTLEETKFKKRRI